MKILILYIKNDVIKKKKLKTDVKKINTFLQKYLKGLTIKGAN